MRDPFSPMVSEELSGMSSDESLGTSNRNSRVVSPCTEYVIPPSSLTIPVWIAPSKLQSWLIWRDDFISSLLDHVAYCEAQGWTATFQEAYRIDEAHVVVGDYAGGFCAEERIPKQIKSPRLRIKPAGTYLQWLNRIDLAMFVGCEGEVPEIAAGDSSSENNPMFAAYDALDVFAKEQGITLVGDLYDVVLSLYGGSFKEAIYTEVSRRIA